jgi:tRNA (guanine6-N2)-methyltransferase
MHRTCGRAPARTRVPVMVRTLRGLEAIARTEVLSLLGGRSPVAVEHRTLRFEVPRVDAQLLSLGTADDVFAVVGELDDVGHRRSALDGLARLARAVDLGGAVSLVAAIRPLTHPIRFDVTASFIGRRNFSRFELEEGVGCAIAAATGWTFMPRGPHSAPATAPSREPREPRSAPATASSPCASGPRIAPPAPSLSFRLHVLHAHATLAVRLAERPLHRRAYRVDSRPGALHPPLARALCLLARPRASHLLVDPTCGGGTIPIEAALLEPRADVAAFDIDPDAVCAARRNAAEAGVHLRLAVGDASSLPLSSGAVDGIVVNPPWGEAVAARGGLRRPESLWSEASRLLAPGGRLVALVPATTAAARPLRAAGLDAEPLACVRVSGAEAVILTAMLA